MLTSLAIDDTNGDAEIQAESDEALALTGRAVGTPFIHFEPPTSVRFRPVVRRLPDEQQAAELWEHVVGCPASPASPSSSAACASGRSCLRSSNM